MGERVVEVLGAGLGEQVEALDPRSAEDLGDEEPGDTFAPPMFGDEEQRKIRVERAAVDDREREPDHILIIERDDRRRGSSRKDAQRTSGVDGERRPTLGNAECEHPGEVLLGEHYDADHGRERTCWVQVMKCEFF
jgi:hypothetical protein